MSNTPQLTSGEIEAILSDELNLSVSDLISLSSEHLGDNSEVFTGNYEGQDIVVKIGDELRWFQMEASVLDLLQKYDLPTPRVLGFLECSKEINRPILVLTKVLGESIKHLGNNQLSPQVWESAGSILKQMNEIKMEGFGWLISSDGALKGEFAQWRDYIGGHHSRAQYIFDHGFIDEDEQRRIEEIFEELEGADIVQPYFLHGDYHGPHIFTDGQKVTGVIDFGGAKAGDPRRDVAYAHYFMSPEARSHFNRGYGDVATEPLVSKYLVLIAVDKIEYRHKRGYLDRLPSSIESLKNAMISVK